MFFYTCPSCELPDNRTTGRKVGNKQKTGVYTQTKENFTLDSNIFQENKASLVIVTCDKRRVSKFLVQEKNWQ